MDGTDEPAAAGGEGEDAEEPSLEDGKASVEVE